MRRYALAAAALAAATALPAQAGTVSEACFSLVPTFRVSGTVCRNVPTDVAAWCFDTVPSFRLSGLVCTKIPAGT